MIPLLAMTGIGIGALYVWHIIHSREVASKALAAAMAFTPTYTDTYVGTPAWPAMPPAIVPDIALPADIQQVATYYGISSNILDQYMADAPSGGN